MSNDWAAHVDFNGMMNDGSMFLGVRVGSIPESLTAGRTDLTGLWIRVCDGEGADGLSGVARVTGVYQGASGEDFAEITVDQDSIHPTVVPAVPTAPEAPMTPIVPLGLYSPDPHSHCVCGGPGCRPPIIC